MKTKSNKKLSLLPLGLAAASAILCLAPGAPARAADHQDAPNLASDLGADLNDCFFFLDPNDNTKIVLSMTVHGFIVPGEAVNFSVFDPTVLFRFLIENTGDAKPDAAIDVTFSPISSTSIPQTATIRLPNGRTFTAPTTVPTLASTAHAQVITNDGPSGASFFAGETDDPFFFDIPAFSRFVASVKAGSPDPSQFNRGRDSFAGYNTLAIAIRLPVSALKGSGPIIGMSTATFRVKQSIDKFGNVVTAGPYYQVDRTGNPAINTVLIPFAKKNAYNAATPQDDAAGRFTPDIVASLTALGTDSTHIGILAGIAVTKGDYLHLNTTIANCGSKGGTNPSAGFPNGRRLADDTIDTILTVVANGTPLGDHVDASDVAPEDSFPFFALPQQPRANGVIDDNTRN